MQTATYQDILNCFRLLLGRDPNAEEILPHFDLVGKPLSAVVSSYLRSTEFRRRGLLDPAVGAELVTLDKFSIFVATDDWLIAPAIRAGYEPDVSEAFLEHLGEGRVLDIGANCGYFSFLAASHGSHVYAFEPMQRNLRLLQAGALLNGFDQVRIIAAAASDSLRTLTIEGVHANAIVGNVEDNSQAALTAEYVAALRVDDVVAGSDLVSLIKIDVEGHEYRAISGALETIRKWRPVIISEFSPDGLATNSGHSGMEYLALLSSLGYVTSVIGQRKVCTSEAILKSCSGKHHVDILAVPS